MAQDTSSLTTFFFYCSEFSEIDEKMKEVTGLETIPKHKIWSMNIDPEVDGEIRVVFTLIYYEKP